jgi:hypothetical protein
VFSSSIAAPDLFPVFRRVTASLSDVAQLPGRMSGMAAERIRPSAVPDSVHGARAFPNATS